MAARQKKRPRDSRELSARQWAWEFLRYNEAYRKAYRDFMGLALCIREPSFLVAEPLYGCLEDTPMSYFTVRPPAETGETVGAWKLRTEVERATGCFIAPLTPKNDFGIDKWIDPELSPLPQCEEKIFDELSFEVHAEFSKSWHPRNKALCVSVGDIERTEVVVKIDIRHPINFLKDSIEKLVLEQRLLLSKTKWKSEIDYKGPKSINHGGVYEAYIKILKRLSNGETRSEIINTTPEGVNGKDDESYVERTKKQYPKAIQLRDGGYRDVARFEAFRGLVRGNGSGDDLS